MHIPVGHKFVHHVGERVARTEFNNLGNAGGSARLHTGSPFDGLLDLARQLFRTCAYVEYRVTVDPAQ
jgi:hypothetical protein